MNKDGFTIIELLAVIVLLGILIGLASFSVINISNRMTKRAYDNLLEEIKTGAENYVADSNEMIFFVNDLITGGYIEAEENGSLLNPRDKSIKMNCFPVVMEFENGFYTAKITETSYEAAGVCDKNALSSSSDNLSIKYNSGVLSGSCPSGEFVIIVSNKGFYQKLNCSGNYSISVTPKGETTYTITYRKSDDTIKSLYTIVN